MKNLAIKSKRKSPVQKIRASRRSRRGSVAEMGPALFLLLVCAVFPMVDVIFACLSYCSCMAANDMEVSEAAKVPSTNSIDTVNDILCKWQFSGLGQFVGLTTQPIVTVTYPDNQYVVVTTKFSVKPLLPIPFFIGLPGLNSPLVYTIADKKLLESPSYAPPINQ
jgi:hypothetical protein